MRACCSLAAAVCIMAKTEAFFLGSPSARPHVAGVRRRSSCTALSEGPTLVDGILYDVVADPRDALPEDKPFVVSEFVELICSPEESSSGWDGFGEPEKLEKLLALPKEARDWEVEDDREEVWEGDPNPPEEMSWMGAFGPSEPELHAAEVGYDFENPEAWEDSIAAAFLNKLRQLSEHGKEWAAFYKANPQKGDAFKAKMAEAMSGGVEELSEEEREVMTAVMDVINQKELAAAE